MRVLVSTTAGSGHFGPLVPVARACAAAGHEVAVAAPASFAASVAATGFAHLPFADAPPELMGPVFAQLASLSFEEANRLIVIEVFGRLDARAAWPDLQRVITAWRPDLVLREPCEFGSLAAAAAEGIPQAMVAIGVSEMTDLVAPLVSGPLAELDAVAGLADGTSAAALAASPTLSSVPPLLDGGADPGPRNPSVHRFCDASLTSGQGALPDRWGDPEHPLVYVSFGSVAGGMGDFAGLYPAVLAAFADRPVRVLLTTGHGLDPTDLGPPPRNVRVERWWPQADVLAHAEAAVGHGGFGTTMAALANAVPQVVVPLFAFDQRLNAEHVAAAGAGLHLDGGPAAIEHVPDAVDALLSGSSHRAAARAVADEVAALPPLDEAVAVLERLAGA